MFTLDYPQIVKTLPLPISHLMKKYHTFQLPATSTCKVLPKATTFTSFLSNTITLLLPTFTLSFLLTHILLNGSTTHLKFLSLFSSNTVICKQTCYHRPMHIFQLWSCTYYFLHLTFICLMILHTYNLS